MIQIIYMNECCVNEKLPESVAQYVRIDVCKNLPTIKYDDRYYCVLHLPDESKSLFTDFKKVIDSRIKGKQTNFTYAFIPDTATFFGRTFISDANFNYAIFKGKPIFNNVTLTHNLLFKAAQFIEGAEFNHVNFNGSVDFSNAVFHEATTFQGAKFFSYLNCNSTTFSSEADFSEVSFAGFAEFESAKFVGSALFHYSHFSENAEFVYANFSGGATFNPAIFEKEAKFDSAEFAKFAFFSSATFSHFTSFLAVKFTCEAYFEHSIFKSIAYFEKARFSDTTFFQKTSFRDLANFGETHFEKDVFFDRARFRETLNFSYASFSKETNIFFRETFFAKAVDFQYSSAEGFIAFSELRQGLDSFFHFHEAAFEKAARISFHTLRLRPCWFVNIDSRSFIFTNIQWNNLPNLSKKSITSETSSIAAANTPTKLKLLEITARQLAVNAEDNNRYEEASSFRLMANEIKRLQDYDGWKIWSLHWWYGLSSSYGESWIRASVILLIIVFLVFPFLYTTRVFQVCPNEKPVSLSLSENICVQKNLEILNGSAILQSLSTATFQTTEYRKPVSGWGEFWIIVEKIFVPIQTALLLLAIRRKFMR